MKCVEVLEEDFKEALSHIDFSKGYDPYSRTFMKALFIGQLLMACKEVEDDVEEEMNGAEKYLGLYKETDDVQYREMAHDELRHAGILIKKHLMKADKSDTEYYNNLEEKRQKMLKLVKAEV